MYAENHIDSRRKESRLAAEALASTVPMAFAVDVEPTITLLRARPHRAVLAAVTVDAASALALLEANAMARAFDAELFVVHVCERSWTSALRPHAHDVAARGPAQKTVHRWCETILGESLPRARVLIRAGAVAASILEVAGELDAELIVLGGAEHTDHGATLTARVIHRAGRPVLVAKGSEVPSAIVAATDLSDTHYPALTHATVLGARFHAPVTFVHNVDPTEDLAPAVVAGPEPATALLVFDETVERRRVLLNHLASTMKARIHAVVVADADTPNAILEIATLADADLLVVGHHGRGLIARLLHHDTAAWIATEARQSVLVVPLRDR